MEQSDISLWLNLSAFGGLNSQTASPATYVIAFRKLSAHLK